MWRWLDIREARRGISDIELGVEFLEALRRHQSAEPVQQPKIADIVDPFRVRQQNVEHFLDIDGRCPAALFEPVKSHQGNRGIPLGDPFLNHARRSPLQRVTEELLVGIEHRHESVDRQRVQSPNHALEAVRIFHQSGFRRAHRGVWRVA